MDLHPWFYLVTLFIYIPTQIVSAYIFYQVFYGTNRKKFGSFYKLFAINFFVGLAFFCTDVVFARPAMLVPQYCDFLLIYLSDPGYLLTPFYFLQYYLQFAQSFFCILISVNRMTAVLFPLRYHYLWSHIYPYTIATVFILPFFFTFQVIVARSMVTKMDDICTIDYIKLIPNVRNSLMSVIVNIISFVSISLCTVVTVYQLSSIKDRARTAELHLVTVAVILGAGALLNSAVQTYIYFIDTTVFTYFLKFCAIDITFICAPWSLFLMSSELRGFRFWRKENNNIKWFTRTSKVNSGN